MTELNPFDDSELRQALELNQTQLEMLDFLLRTATELFEHLVSRTASQEQIDTWRVLLETTRQKLNAFHAKREQLVDGLSDG